MPPSEPTLPTYTRTAIALHWLVAAAVVVQFTWGWWMQGIPKQPVGPRVDAYNLHKSIGLTILAVMCVRAWWRWRHPPPPLPAMPAWQATLAHATHGVLYLALFAMPLAGYLGSVYSGYPVKYFGVTLPAWGTKSEAVKDFMSAAHLTVSFVLAAAVLLHVAGAVKHALVDRDGLGARMGLGRGGAGTRS
ncbi:MAG: cytochrome b [Burkholderiales bacterium]